MSDCDVWKVEVTLGTASRRLEEMSAEERMLASYASAKVKPYVAIEADSNHITASRVADVTTSSIASAITAKKVALNAAANGITGVSGAATPDSPTITGLEKSGGSTQTNNSGNNAASTSGTVTMGVSSVLLVLMGLFVM